MSPSALCHQAPPSLSLSLAALAIACRLSRCLLHLSSVALSPVLTCVTCLHHLRHLRPPAPCSAPPASSCAISAPHTATLEPAEHARVPPQRVRRSGPQLLSRTSLPTAPVLAPLLPPEPCFSRPYPAYPETPAPHTLRTACTSMRMGSCEHEDVQLHGTCAHRLRHAV